MYYGSWPNKLEWNLKLFLSVAYHKFTFLQWKWFFFSIYSFFFKSCSLGLGLSTKVITPPGSIITTCQHQNTSCQPTSGEGNEESRRHSKKRGECTLFERTSHYEAVREEEVVHNTSLVTEVSSISSRRSARFTMTTVVLIVDLSLAYCYRLNQKKQRQQAWGKQN